MIYKSEGSRLYQPEHNKVATKGQKVSKERRSRWTKHLTYLEYDRWQRRIFFFIRVDLSATCYLFLLLDYCEFVTRRM